jgi:integrase
MERTQTPGIFKRGSRYVVVYRAGGRQRKESCRTLAEARAVRAARLADAARGELFEASRITFAAYAMEWVERYQGRGRRGFRDATRDDYRRDLRRYALAFFHERRRLADVTPRDLAQYVAWLCERRDGRGGEPLADATVRRIVAPVRAALASAVAEGLIRHNPAQGLALPHRPKVEDEDADEVRALDREQLRALLAVVHPDHRVLFRLLAATGLRISEAIALRWQHIALDSEPRVRVRRALVRGRIGPPKSRHGRRDVPLDRALAAELRRRRATATRAADDDLVFPSRAGTPLRPENLRRRVLRPAAEEACASWAGFHTLRHTCASLLFARGANAVQVQRWLGHHSPAFTLATYVHLLPGEGAPALDLMSELYETPTRERGVAACTG